MTPREIVRYRLFNQQIAHTAHSEPEAVVAALGAVQAQDYAGALWAIGLRLPDATETVIERAVAERKIIRTWPMRGTLHFTAAADVRWMLELFAPQNIARSAFRHRQLELNEAVFAKSQKLLVRALKGGGRLTRDAMLQALERGRISTAGQRGYHILWRLAQEGVLCFGPREGRQPTFVLLDEWAPKTRILNRDETLAELARRYFTSRGPAILRDFIWWSGLKVSDAKAGLDSVSTELQRETLGGMEYWMPRNTPTLRGVPNTVHLLPGFDEYLLGYKDRGASLDPLDARKISPSQNGMFFPVIVIDGRVAGTWKRAIGKKKVTVKASPFAPMKKNAARAFAAAAERYGRFVGLPVELNF